MSPLWWWLFPVFMGLGLCTMLSWFFGLLNEGRAHPDRTLLKLRGINPFNGPQGLVDLAPAPRKWYVRASYFWIWYFVVWAILLLSTFGFDLFTMFGVTLGGAIVAWILYSISIARSRLSAADWQG